MLDFLDIYVNTDEIGIGFEADIPENESNMSSLATFILDQVWYLIVLIHDICPLYYFQRSD